MNPFTGRSVLEVKWCTFSRAVPLLGFVRLCLWGPVEELRVWGDFNLSLRS